MALAPHRPGPERAITSGGRRLGRRRARRRPARGRARRRGDIARSWSSTGRCWTTSGTWSRASAGLRDGAGVPAHRADHAEGLLHRALRQPPQAAGPGPGRLTSLTSSLASRLGIPATHDRLRRQAAGVRGSSARHPGCLPAQSRRAPPRCSWPRLRPRLRPRCRRIRRRCSGSRLGSCATSRPHARTPSTAHPSTRPR
jgi:hypothetical protein